LESEKEQKVVMMQGAVWAGCRFFAGYPITPSSEIAEYLSRKLPTLGGKFIQMEDEIGSIAAVIGASLTGVKSMTATSGPGFSLKQENIGYAAMAEVPCVIVDVQRGGPSTGTPTLPSQMDVQQARWGTHGDHEIIVLTASSAQEAFEQTIRAFNLSERFMTPVILLLDEIVGHSTEKVVFPDRDSIEIIDRKQPDVPPEKYLPYGETEDLIPVLAKFGSGYRYNVTGLCHDETGFPTNDPDTIKRLIVRLSEKITKHKEEIIDYNLEMMDDAEVAIFAYGSVVRAARRAMRDCRENGRKVGLISVKVLWPFPSEAVLKVAESVKKIVVPEMNLGQMAREVELAAKCNAEIIRVNRVDGNPITPMEIEDKIREVM